MKDAYLSFVWVSLRCLVRYKGIRTSQDIVKVNLNLLLLRCKGQFISVYEGSGAWVDGLVICVDIKQEKIKNTPLCKPVLMCPPSILFATNVYKCLCCKSVHSVWHLRSPFLVRLCWLTVFIWCIQTLNMQHLWFVSIPSPMKSVMFRSWPVQDFPGLNHVGFRIRWSTTKKASKEPLYVAY